ncbi:integration host factor subunit beta domain protein, partial [[Clostridium] symbiosum ATCC 14940]
PKRPAAGGESRGRDSFLIYRKVPLLNKNRSAGDRTAAAGNYVVPVK